MPKMFGRIALAPLILLAGCVTLPAIPFLGGGGAPSLSLLGGDVTAVGPNGYCVDPESSSARSGFAIIAPCDTMGPFEGTAPSRRGLLSLQVGAEGAVDLDGVANLLSNADTREALLGTDEVLTRSTLDSGSGVLVVYRTKAPASDRVQPLEARAFLSLANRLSTVMVRGTSKAPLSAEGIERLALDAISALTAANRAEAADAS